jgi:cytochrome P450
VSHQALVAEDFFAGRPGFEGVTAVSDPSETLIGLIKSRLSQNKFVDRFSRCASEFLRGSWKEDADWHEIPWANDGTNLVGRMSSSVFVGEELARNEQWQKISISYAVNMFQGARVLRSWPTWTRSFIHWFLKECKVCRAEVRNADALLKSEIQRRSTAEEKHEDTITWMHFAAKGRPYNATSAQLGLSMAAVITTSELLKQSLINICAHLELVTPLREEIEQAVGQHGWSAATLAQMPLLDSVIKETQRLYPMSEGMLHHESYLRRGASSS